MDRDTAAFWQWWEASGAHLDTPVGPIKCAWECGAAHGRRTGSTDLLAACQAVLDASEVGNSVFECDADTPIYPDDGSWFTLRLVEMLRAAVARAEGGAS